MNKILGDVKMKKILIALFVSLSISVANVSAASFGVCSHMGLFDSYSNIDNIEAAEEVEVSWLRDECRWANMQTSENGEFKIKSKDLDYIQKIDANGINQLLILAYGNTNYAGVSSDTVIPKQENANYYNGWLNYVREVVTEVKDYVDAYEVWNEPNISLFNYNMGCTGTDYAKLYLDTKAIIDDLDPTAKVLCGAVTGYDTDALNYGKAIFDYIDTNGDINSLIDAFSIHLYTQLDDESYANGLSAWEGIFDRYGYTGEVWMTENGVTSDGTDGRTTDEQAALVAKLGIQWDKYLKENNRTGVNFWYDLRNEVGISDYEDNFGLFTMEYALKPSGNAMRLYNNLTGDKALDNVTRIKTKDYTLTSDEYGYVATYSSDTGTTYILYDSNSNGKSYDITLSGDIAYAYDCQGNITETIVNPSGTKSVQMAASPVYVECITYNAQITTATYDANDGVITVSGTYNGGDNVTIELLKNGETVMSQTAVVNDNKFSKWFSYSENGEYLLRVGYPEILDMGKSTGWAEQSFIVNEDAQINPTFDASTKIAYNAENRKVNISGAITDFAENQILTVLAIPETMDINSVDIAAAAYIRQIQTTEGKFTAEFEVPEWFTTNMAIYLGGTGIKTKTSEKLNIPESEYVYVASLELNKGSVLKATAVVRNFTETSKKATIVIAQYNGTRLENVEIENKTIPANQYSAIECSLNNVVIDGDATTAKAFILSDMTGLVPLETPDEVGL